MKRLGQILLAVLIIVKVVLGTIFISRLDLGDWFGEGKAMASESQLATTPPAAAKTTAPNIPSNPPETVPLAPISKEQVALEQQKAELLAIQADINQKIETLRKLRSEIRAEAAKQTEIEQGKLKHLIKVYSTMKPQKAATLVEKLDLSFAIQLLSQMKGDAVGNILSFVETEKAARISQELLKPAE
jgi:flagellar motility protein MotE (MotC chaperone)